MKEYWYCMIGPIERDKVPSEGDFFLRQVKHYFRHVRRRNEKDK